MVDDAAEYVAAKKQKLRQRDEVFERRTLDTAEFQAVDRSGEIGDGNSPTRIAPGVDHHRAFSRPVSSAG
jgi:hypothetical protein